MNSFFGSFQSYRKLPKAIWALTFARVVNTLGAFVHPFLALLLVDRLGYGEADAGRTIMFVAIVGIPGSLLGGKIADSWGRKRILAGAQIMGGLSLVVCGFLGDSPAILGFLMVQQFFMGFMMPASSAIAADLTTPANRKEAFSLLYLGLNLGYAVGPLLAGLLYANHTQWLFWGDGLTALFSAVIVMVYVPETLGLRQDTSLLGQEEQAEKSSLIKALLKRPRLLIFISLMTLGWFIYAQSDFSLPLAVMEIFPEKGSTIFGKLRAINAIVVVLFTVPLIVLTRRIKPLYVVTSSYIFYALGFGMVGMLHTPWGFYLSTFIWTLGEILGATNIQVYITNHTPLTHRGRFNSLLPLIMGSGRTAAPWITGLFIEQKSLSAVWGLTVKLALAGFLGLMLLGWWEHWFPKPSAPVSKGISSD